MRRSEAQLEEIAANAERAAVLDERDRLLAMLVLNRHLTTGKERERCSMD